MENSMCAASEATMEFGLLQYSLQKFWFSKIVDAGLFYADLPCRSWRRSCESPKSAT